MTQRLKRWESPRRQGRNDKGRGGAARQRQLKKREKLLRKRLKAQAQKNNQDNHNSPRRSTSFSFFFECFFQYGDRVNLESRIASNAE